MKIKIEVQANINTLALHRKIMNNDPFWRFAAAEWHKLYAPYVPMAEGFLTDSVTITPGKIEHTMPYARYQYYGDRFRHRHDRHFQASARWDQKAEPTQKPMLISTLQAYINSGRVNFDV